jgi:DtxR family Mn-dependent transcriptional regulator
MEDYLETILILVKERKVARVKDIARIRDVKPGSVSPAMKKLAEMGLIVYVQREFIDLTPKGVAVAENLLDKHKLLARFFTEILNLDSEESESQACAVEHCLSPSGARRLAQLIKYLKNNPQIDLKNFYQNSQTDETTIVTMKPGQNAIILQLFAKGDFFYQLMQLGLMPNCHIKLKEVDKKEQKYTVTLKDSNIVLDLKQAKAVIVSVY